MLWSDINRISCIPVFSHHSETAHIPLSLPEVSTLQVPPLAYPRNTLFLVNAPPHVIGRGTPFTTRLPLSCTGGTELVSHFWKDLEKTISPCNTWMYSRGQQGFETGSRLRGGAYPRVPKWSTAEQLRRTSVTRCKLYQQYSASSTNEWMWCRGQRARGMIENKTSEKRKVIPRKLW